MHLTIDRFGGLAPIFAPRKLPQSLATTATDCRFVAGDLEPLRSAVPPTAASFAVSAGRMMRWNGQWLAWPDTLVVDPVRSPIPQDSLQRLYWTQVGSGDGFPRVLSQPTLGQTLQNGSAIRRLGVPVPNIGSHLGVGEVRAPFSAMPQTMSPTSPVRVSAPNHPFKDGQRVVVKLFGEQAMPSNFTGGMIEINGLEFVVGNTTASTFDLRGSDGANYSAFETNKTPAAVIERVYGETDLVSRSYVYTFVSTWGEEGPPCVPSNVIDIRHDSAVRLKRDGVAIPAGYSGINRVRIYRSAASDSTSGFFFVAELPITSPSYTIDFTDNVDESALGELLPSTEWAPPPSGLQGLTQMPNGFLAGFKGNTLYFSEPYMPHAWPDRYRRTTATDIVGMAVYGQTLVVATKAKPYLAEGTDPASVSLRELDEDAPCLAKGSVVPIGSGVAYASWDGLVVVSGAGARNVTSQHFTKEQFALLCSPTMEAIFHDGRYIAFHRDTGLSSWMAEINADGVNFSVVSDRGRAPAIATDTDGLFYIGLRSNAWLDIVAFDGWAPRNVQWRSKVFTLPQPVNFGAAQVFAAAYPVTLTVFYGLPRSVGAQTPVTPQPDQFHTYTVAGPDPFRLHPGFLSREWQVLVSGQQRVHSIVLAESMEEIRQL